MERKLQIPLAETIRALRHELLMAVRAGEQEDLRFALGPVELELQLEIARETGGEAGIAFWVISLGGKGSRSSATTHTVKLTLTPVSESGDVLVGSAVSERPD
jgi:Trypsin-co-occurring domain 2